MLPTEIIDLLVAFSPPELVLAFTMVSKRYSRLLVPNVGPSDSRYFNYNVIKEREIGDKNCLLKKYIKRAKYLSSFIKSKKTFLQRMKYLPIFDSMTLQEQISSKKYSSKIFEHQDLESIKCFLSFGAKIYDWTPYAEAFVMNPHYDVFMYGIKHCKKGVQRAKYYEFSDILTYERLYYILDNGIPVVNWEAFLCMSDDLEMYKKVCEILGYHNLEFNLCHCLAIKPNILEWITTTVKMDKIDCLNTVFSEWNYDSVIYLFEKALLDARTVWCLIIRNNNDLLQVDDNFIEKIPLPNVEDLIGGGAFLGVLKLKYTLEGSVPTMEDIIMSIELNEYGDFSEYIDWAMEISEITKKQIRQKCYDADILNPRLISWLLLDNLDEEEILFIIKNKLKDFWDLLPDTYFNFNPLTDKMIEMIKQNWE